MTTATKPAGLMSALLAVQAEAPALQKSKINPAFKSKYVSLDTLMETVMPIVNKHGLVWVTLPGRDEHGDPALTYRLIHAESSESVDGTMPLMLAKTDPQGQGSAITYARRYSLMAVLGLVADEDDDGNKASGRPANQRAANGHTQVVAEPSNGGPKLASAKQRGLLNAKAGEAGLPASRFANCILLASGAEEPREFDTEEAAQALVNRMLDRLPAQLVNPVLASIEAST